MRFYILVSNSKNDLIQFTSTRIFKLSFEFKFQMYIKNLKHYILMMKSILLLINIKDKTPKSFVFCLKSKIYTSIQDLQPPNAGLWASKIIGVSSFSVETVKQ